MLNPWEVKGKIDYSRLIKEFGLKELKNSKLDHLLFRRNVIYAHRDLDKILDCIKNKKPFAMMTGLMPSGKFHVGHMMVAQQMIFWQKMGAKIYIAVADIESYNTRGQSLKDSRKIAEEEYIKNYIALGLKPKNCEIYFQSERSKDSKKSNIYYQLQNLLARHVTFNEFKSIYGEISPGKMISALLQASDMLHPMILENNIPVIVPVGIDQDPHIRLARDISRRIKEFKFNTLASTYHQFMPGLGGGKMSSSNPNSYIALTDTPNEAEKKIKKYAFSGGRVTLEEHRKLGGNPDIDVSFQYLKLFFEEDDVELEKIYENYKSGKLLTGELKQILIDKMKKFLKEHNIKRSKVDINKFLK
tara:strand:- start:46 stop:1122 length:1077 start_codon:yes stop_codon:yes gene_type:complete